jgi:hypothetical protein
MAALRIRSKSNRFAHAMSRFLMINSLWGARTPSTEDSSGKQPSDSHGAALLTLDNRQFAHSSPFPASVIFAWVWNALPYPLMRPDAIEVVNIFADNTIRMTFIQDQQVIQAFTSHAANKSLTAGVISVFHTTSMLDLLFPTLLCTTVLAGGGSRNTRIA